MATEMELRRDMTTDDEEQSDGDWEVLNSPIDDAIDGIDKELRTIDEARRGSMGANRGSRIDECKPSNRRWKLTLKRLRLVRLRKEETKKHLSDEAKAIEEAMNDSDDIDFDQLRKERNQLTPEFKRLTIRLGIHMIISLLALISTTLLDKFYYQSTDNNGPLRKYNCVLALTICVHFTIEILVWGGTKPNRTNILDEIDSMWDEDEGRRTEESLEPRMYWRICVHACFMMFLIVLEDLSKNFYFLKLEGFAKEVGGIIEWFFVVLFGIHCAVFALYQIARCPKGRASAYY